MNTKWLPFTGMALLLVAWLGCSKKQEKIPDARSLSEEERTAQKFVPYFPHKSPSHTFRNHVEETSWQSFYDVRSPKVGMKAPDFELSDVAGEETFKLSEFTGKQPVALVFGSFT